VHGKHNPTSNLFKYLWRIFLFGALNLDWGSGRDLCPCQSQSSFGPFLLSSGWAPGITLDTHSGAQRSPPGAPSGRNGEEGGGMETAV